MFEVTDERSPAEVDKAKPAIKPSERLKMMALKNPLVQLLRKPGVVSPGTLPQQTRSAEIRVKIMRAGKLDDETSVTILALKNGCCKLANSELGLQDEIENLILVSLASNGQTNWVHQKAMRVAGIGAQKSIRVSFHRKDLKEFLLAAGVMKIGV